MIPEITEHRVRRGNVELHVEERGAGEPTVLLVHGIACDRRFLRRQAEHLAARHRTVAVDLRGHGRSDTPPGPYDVDAHLDDLVAVCRVRRLERPVVVGHSLGGVLALMLAAREPDLPRAVVLLDAPVVPPPGRDAVMHEHFAALRGDYASELVAYFSRFFEPDDDPGIRAWVLREILRPPAAGVIATWEHAVEDHDTQACAAACRAALLYLDAGTPNARLERLVELCPQTVLGRTVGAGHFHQLLVPDQVNAMLERFLALVTHRSNVGPDA